jgi:hypothetical protein
MWTNTDGWNGPYAASGFSSVCFTAEERDQEAPESTESRTLPSTGCHRSGAKRVGEEVRFHEAVYDPQGRALQWRTREGPGHDRKLSAALHPDKRREGVCRQPRMPGEIVVGAR